MVEQSAISKRLVMATVTCLVLLLQPASGDLNVVVVRHGERPANKNKDKGHLTQDGKNRATHLANTWGSGSGPLTNVGKTAIIYAYGSNAYREKELMEPLHNKIGGDFKQCNLINTKFGCGDGIVPGMNKCAKNLLNSYEKTHTDVVISWEHGCIEKLVKDLNNGKDGVVSGVNWGECNSACSPSCSKWSGDSDGKENKKGCFDVYFQFNYKSGKTPKKGAQGFVGNAGYEGNATGLNSTASYWTV